MRVQV